MDFYLKHGESNPRNSEGSFTVLKDGGILCAYTRYSGGEGHDHDSADIAGVISRDNGRSWSDAGILVKNTSLNVMSVSLLNLQNGKIAMVYSRKDRASDGKGVCCRSFFITSDDETQSWSPPVPVHCAQDAYIVVNNDRLVQLKSGRLILPGAWYRPGSRQGIAVFWLSDDDGATWREAHQCCYPPQWLASGLAEPGVVELKDGTLLGWARTNGGSQYKFFSHDGGETWSVPQPAGEFLSPESPLSMKRNPQDGLLYAVWNDWNPRNAVHPEPRSKGRTPLVIARSADEGLSWSGFTVLENEPDHGYAYTAMLFNGEELLLEYCCGGGKGNFMLQDSKIRVLDLKRLNL